MRVVCIGYSGLVAAGIVVVVFVGLSVVGIGAGKIVVLGFVGWMVVGIGN